VAQDQLLDRMDAQYWRPRFRVLDALWADSVVPWVAIGDLDPFMTYGVIATGDKSTPQPGGELLRIDPSALRNGTIDLAACVRVRVGSVWDMPRTRVRAGDLLFVRSGVASLGRTAVFDAPAAAVVGCFVDIVRQDKLCPHYLCAFLHSRIARLQIDRTKSGVGTVNLNFDEIRSLRLLLLPQPEQREVSALWRAGDPDSRRQAVAAFDQLLPGDEP